MQTHSKTLLCRYHYDPLDRLADCTLSGQESARRFYQKDRLTTEIHGTVKRSIMQHDVQLLAQQQRQSDSVETSLLTTDQQRTVLNVLAASGPQPIAHTPYGHCPLASSLLSLLGFNGERPDPVTGHYLLGNGYRGFNPILMRFDSPDSWSPFGKGGLNAYAYCVGDPVNRNDPTGHFGNPWKGFMNFLRFRTPRSTPDRYAHTIANRTPTISGLPAGGPLAVSNEGSSSIYSSVGSGSSGQPSSGYASVQSYSSVDPSFAPPVPNYSPPGSTRSGSRFSVQNPNREPSGMPDGDVQDWVNSTSNALDPDLERFSQIPRAGARVSSSEHLAVQHAGLKFSRNVGANFHLYGKGIIPNSLEGLRTKFYERKMLKIRNK